MEIKQLDPTDATDVREWYDVMISGIREGLTEPSFPSFSEVRTMLAAPSSIVGVELFAALVDGTMAGGLLVVLPRRENLLRAELQVSVLPACRRRGVGSAILARGEERAAANGRTTVTAMVWLPADQRMESTPGVAFAGKRGLTLANVRSRRQLMLPLPAAGLEELSAYAGRSPGYRLVSWVGSCPDRYTESLAHLKGLALEETPSGELDNEAEIWDVGRLREREQQRFAQGQQLYTTVAEAPDGAVAGHSQLFVSRDRPEQATQLDMLVLRAHRGRRLGLALAAANLRHVQERESKLQRIETINVDGNDALASVTDRLGYRIVERIQTWQRVL